MNKITLARLEELKSICPGRPHSWYVRQARADTKEFIGAINPPKDRLTFEQVGMMLKRYFLATPINLYHVIEEIDEDDKARIAFAEECGYRPHGKQIKGLLLTRRSTQSDDWTWTYRQVVDLLTPASWLCWCSSRLSHEALDAALVHCGKLGLTVDDFAQGANTPIAINHFLHIARCCYEHKEKGTPPYLALSGQMTERLLRRAAKMGLCPVTSLPYMPDDLIETVVANTIKSNRGHLAADCIFYGSNRLTTDQIARLTAVDPSEVAEWVSKHNSWRGRR